MGFTKGGLSWQNKQELTKEEKESRDPHEEQNVYGDWGAGREQSSRRNIHTLTQWRGGRTRNGETNPACHSVKESQQARPWKLKSAELGSRG